MSLPKYLFIDRDGTLIVEPADFQIDSLEKLALVEGVIPALITLKAAGYEFVMVSNQDGLGTASFSQEKFAAPHEAMMKLFKSQGIDFKDVLICPHFDQDGCFCRKPQLGLVVSYMSQVYDKDRSYVIGDRATDIKLAENMGIKGLRLGELSWNDITRCIVDRPRRANVRRVTHETTIEVSVDLDDPSETYIKTGLGFFDHMLEQLSKHSGIGMQIAVKGDLHIDEHHTVEDTALALGECLRKALGDKRGIDRYGFSLPMDEASAHALIDLSGRAFLKFEGKYPRDIVGDLPTEMVSHFFRSLADSMQATIHISVSGENTHHMVESTFKVMARALRLAVATNGSSQLPTTKGVL